LSLARIPMHVVSMRVEKHASLNKFLMPCDFLNAEEKMKHSTIIIIMSLPLFDFY
jgi:hypothetical protein